MAEASEVGEKVWKVGFARFLKAFKDIRKFKDLFWFLLTFLVYANGIGTIITMAAAFATDLGFSTITILGTFLMVHLLPRLSQFCFGKLAKNWAQKSHHHQPAGLFRHRDCRYFMTKEWHFYALALG